MAVVGVIATNLKFPGLGMYQAADRIIVSMPILLECVIELFRVPSLNTSLK
jgi:hypothetical protein